MHKHPYYKGAATKQGYDIAVIELNTCVDYNDKVFPICVDSAAKPQSSSDIKVQHNLPLRYTDPLQPQPA